MVKRKHAIISKDRRAITKLEWALLLGKSRHTITARIEAYEKASGARYNPYDIFSVLRFYKFVLTNSA